MNRIGAIIRPDKVDSVKDALGKVHVSGLTVTEVRGHGHQKGHTDTPPTTRSRRHREFR